MSDKANNKHGIFHEFLSLMKPPKWRLVPDKRGTYTLEKLDSLNGYLCEAVRVSPEEADKIIERLDRKILYYREKD